MSSVLGVVGVASVGVGAAYLLSALAFLAQPAELRGAGWPHEFWLAFGEGASAHLALHWISAVVGVLGLAVVPACLRLMRARAEGLALWASALAYLGFAVTARSHLMEVEFDLSRGADLRDARARDPGGRSADRRPRPRRPSRLADAQGHQDEAKQAG